MLQAIYCDDIRHEAGEKLSYMGAYNGILYVPSFPTKLPKFCIAVKVVSPMTRTFESLLIQILKDEDILQEISLNQEQLQIRNGPQEKDPQVDEEDLVQTVDVNFAFVPFQLDEPFILRVRAETNDGEIIRGLGLRVAQFPSKE